MLIAWGLSALLAGWSLSVSAAPIPPLQLLRAPSAVSAAQPRPRLLRARYRGLPGPRIIVDRSDDAGAASFPAPRDEPPSSPLPGFSGRAVEDGSPLRRDSAGQSCPELCQISTGGGFFCCGVGAECCVANSGAGQCCPQGTQCGPNGCIGSSLPPLGSATASAAAASGAATVVITSTSTHTVTAVSTQTVVVTSTQTDTITFVDPGAATTTSTITVTSFLPYIKRLEQRFSRELAKTLQPPAKPADAVASSTLSLPGTGFLLAPTVLPQVALRKRQAATVTSTQTVDVTTTVTSVTTVTSTAFNTVFVTVTAAPSATSTVFSTTTVISSLAPPGASAAPPPVATSSEADGGAGGSGGATTATTAATGPNPAGTTTPTNPAGTTTPPAAETGPGTENQGTTAPAGVTTTPAVVTGSTTGTGAPAPITNVPPTTITTGSTGTGAAGAGPTHTGTHSGSLGNTGQPSGTQSGSNTGSNTAATSPNTNSQTNAASTASTTSTSTESPSPAPTGGSGRNGLSTEQIAGVVVGLLFFVILVLLIAFLIRRTVKRKKDQRLSQRLRAAAAAAAVVPPPDSPSGRGRFGAMSSLPAGGVADRGRAISGPMAPGAAGVIIRPSAAHTVRSAMRPDPFSNTSSYYLDEEGQDIPTEMRQRQGMLSPRGGPGHQHTQSDPMRWSLQGDVGSPMPIAAAAAGAGVGASAAAALNRKQPRRNNSWDMILQRASRWGRGGSAVASPSSTQTDAGARSSSAAGFVSAAGAMGGRQAEDDAVSDDDDASIETPPLLSDTPPPRSRAGLPPPRPVPQGRPPPVPSSPRTAAGLQPPLRPPRPGSWAPQIPTPIRVSPLMLGPGEQGDNGHGGRRNNERRNNNHGGAGWDSWEYGSETADLDSAEGSRASGGASGGSIGKAF